VEISRMRLDTYIGMGYSNVISLFIIVATAATLNAHGITNIQTSAQAAEALRPIAGVFTFALFSAGIIGIGLLAVPVLAGSGAYAIGEALGWTTGLDRKPLDCGKRGGVPRTSRRISRIDRSYVRDRYDQTRRKEE
jgi:Mn2+/Fe2+ NRAMP family transporter